MNPCEICNENTKSKCSNCNQIYYCSVEHQKQHWRTHKSNCHPFKIVQNEELGRHLVATRNIKPFEIILKESPLVRGPSQVTGVVCLGCLNLIEPNNYITCEKCGWPMCSTECANNPEHKAECELTSGRDHKVNVQQFTSPHPLYQCLSTVRCLLLRQTNQSNWEKFIQLESLENERRGSLQWKADLECIANFIPKFFNTNSFKEDEIMKTVGILQINGHEVPTSDPSHIATYYNASFLEHSCLPNLAKSFTKDGTIILFAPNPIKKNSNLSICYADAVWGTAHRQRYLMHTKLFKCQCLRCLDVTELGTHYDALKCKDPKCDGFVLPKNFKESNDNWKCNLCEMEADKTFIYNILERAEKDSQAMEKTQENCLKYIQHYQKWLPPQHFYMSEVKIQLVQQIGSNPKDLMVITDETLNVKIDNARELIKLYETLAPCEVRLIGTLCFELHSAIAEHTRRVSLQTSLSPLHLLEESLFYVEKCVGYLQYESNIFIEGHIVKQAKINRDALKLVLKM